MTEDECKNRIDSFAALPENWDRYGAKVISKSVVEKAKSIAYHFVGADWCVYPTVDGGIEFEHVNGNSLNINSSSPRYTVYIETDTVEQTIFAALKNLQ